ncbi:MAG: argininosuccinate lyase [Burkholderiaceae bacterium]|nr:MAG: argininosuccinate lyase [Burkholderiaceae bacterium]
MTNQQGAYTDGRLGVRPSVSMIENVNKLELEYELSVVQEFIQTDLAHVVMLTEVGILDDSEGGAILGALLKLKRSPNINEVLRSDPQFGGLLFQIENYLARTCGPVGHMLHTGRSRIDQDAEVMRLVARRVGMEVVEKSLEFADVVLKRSIKEIDTICPLYTQLQHGQPGTLGYYLNGQYWVMTRNLERVQQTIARYDYCSLGGVALTGTDWQIKRERVSQLLGHIGPVVHATDAGIFALDVAPDMGASLALLAGALGRIAGDFYYWSSSELNYIQIDPSLCGTSSIMPQKRNPYALERTRAIAGEAVGWMAVELGVLKSATSTDLDVVLTDARIPGMAKQTIGALQLMADVIRTMAVDVGKMRSSAESAWITASAIADVLVRTLRVPFRDAHGIVGRLVRLADGAMSDDRAARRGLLIRALEESGVAATGLTEEEWCALMRSMESESFIETRSSDGGAGREQRGRLTELAKADLMSKKTHHEEIKRRVSASEEELTKVAQRLAMKSSG